MRIALALAALLVTPAAAALLVTPAAAALLPSTPFVGIGEGRVQRTFQDVSAGPHHDCPGTRWVVALTQDASGWFADIALVEREFPLSPTCNGAAAQVRLPIEGSPSTGFAAHFSDGCRTIDHAIGALGPTTGYQRTFSNACASPGQLRLQDEHAVLAFGP